VKAGVAGDEALAQLRELVAAEGGELAAALVDAPAGEAFGPLMAAAKRCRDRAGDYALLIESILEGYLVHYRRPRLMQPPDENLRLLAGDYLYALGLARLAALGDLAAVHELADVIALCAQAHSGPGPAPDDVAEAIWALGAIGVAGGLWDEGEASKRRLREDLAGASTAAREAALRRAAELGIEQEAQRALIAFRGISEGRQAADSAST
jgi:hypothetical protein